MGTNIYKTAGFPAVIPHPENIPDDLKQMRWAVWVAEPKTDKSDEIIPGKFNKAPRNPRTGAKAGADNPANFDTYEQALAALNTGEYSGFGPVLDGTVTEQKHLAIIDGPCGATGAAAGNNPRLASFDEIRRTIPKPLEEISGYIRKLLGG